MTLCFHSYGYLVDLQDSYGKLDLRMDTGKDYRTSVYELYSYCYGKITSHIGKL